MVKKIHVSRYSIGAKGTFRHGLRGLLETEHIFLAIRYYLGSGNRYRRHCGGSARCTKTVQEADWLVGTKIALYEQVTLIIKATRIHKAGSVSIDNWCLEMRGLIPCLISRMGGQRISPPRTTRNMSCALLRSCVCGAKYIILLYFSGISTLPWLDKRCCWDCYFYKI